MRFVEEVSDRRILEGMRQGLFDNLPGKGKPIADLGQQRKEGWWAHRFVARDKAKMLQEDTLREIDKRTSALWALKTKTAVRSAVAEAQALLTDCNRRTRSSAEPLDPLDEQQLISRWEAVRARRGQQQRKSLY